MGLFLQFKEKILCYHNLKQQTTLKELFQPRKTMQIVQNNWLWWLYEFCRICSLHHTESEAQLGKTKRWRTFFLTQFTKLSSHMFLSVNKEKHSFPAVFLITVANSQDSVWTVLIGKQKDLNMLLASFWGLSRVIPPEIYLTAASERNFLVWHLFHQHLHEFRRGWDMCGQFQISPCRGGECLLGSCSSSFRTIKTKWRSMMSRLSYFVLW